MTRNVNDAQEHTVANSYYYAGVKQALEDAGVKVAYYGDSYMGASPSRSRGAEDIPAPPPPPPKEEELAGPDYSPLWKDFQVSEFADLPENFQFEADAAPEQVQSYIDAGNRYIGQVQQVYAYLLQQGMDARRASAQAKQLVARNFQRYSLPG